MYIGLVWRNTCTYSAQRYFHTYTCLYKSTVKFGKIAFYFKTYFLFRKFPKLYVKNQHDNKFQERATQCSKKTAPVRKHLTKSRKEQPMSDFTFTFHFHALEEEMATHSSVPAWRIPGTAEPGGLPSMGSHRVGYDRSDLAQHSIA